MAMCATVGGGWHGAAAALLVCFTPILFVAVLLKVGNLGTHNSSFLRITKSRDNLRDWRFLYALIFKLGKRR